ncbi:hypothetical protein Tco_0957991 [Tanacetum coccineum]
MSALKFADSHNMVAFLAKPTESEGLEQIVDFLNVNPIKYALTVNLIICTSCIEQFWATTKVKTVNGDVQLQALVDGKKVIITKTNVRRYLQLEDAEGIEFFLDKQVGDMSTHDEIFVTPSHTKKVFGNMKMVKKGFFSRRKFITPLFPTMMVQDQEEMGEEKKQKPRKPKRKDIEISQSNSPTEPIADEAAKKENVLTHSNDPLLSGEDSLKLNDLMETCTKLQQRVLDLENTKTAQAQEISSLKLRVKRLEKKRGPRTHKIKILFKVGRSAQVVSSEDEGQDMVEKEVSTADLVTTAGEVVTTASVEVSAATTKTTTAITEVDLTLTQALAQLRSAKPKVIVQEYNTPIFTYSSGS